MPCEKTACGLPKGTPFAIENLTVIIEPRVAQTTLTLRFNGTVDTVQVPSDRGGIDAVLKAIDTLVGRKAPGMARFDSSRVNSATTGTGSDAQVTVRVIDAKDHVQYGVFEYPDTVIATAQAYVNVLNEIYSARSA